MSSSSIHVAKWKIFDDFPCAESLVLMWLSGRACGVSYERTTTECGKSCGKPRQHDDCILTKACDAYNALKEFEDGK